MNLLMLSIWVLFVIGCVYLAIYLLLFKTFLGKRLYNWWKRVTKDTKTDDWSAAKESNNHIN